MFWKFNVLNSPIDTLLDKEDITLREILDEDDVLQECRAQNKKLVDFLVQPDHLLDLVQMVIDEPDPSLDDKSKYKYPNLCCEILTCEVPEITEKLVTEETLLNKIYGFLENDGPLNPLQASFFSKVLSLLIARKSDIMLDYLQSKDDFVGHLLHHIGVSAIMDLLLRLITCIQCTEVRSRCITWLNEEQLISRLISMIDPGQSEEKHSNASQALCDMIVLNREHMSELQELAESDPLLESIESKDTVSDLLKHMLDGAEKSESVIVHGVNVIQTLLEFRKIGPEGSNEKMTALDAERLAHGVRNTIDAVLPRLRDLAQVLSHPPKQHYSPMPTTIGVLSPPLGNSRLQIIHLIASLLLTNTASVNQELSNIQVMSTIFDLFFQYSWCNFLHSQVEACVIAIVTNPPCTVGEKEEHPLLDQLFRELRILQLIIDAFNGNEEQQSQPSGRRMGYMGHLTRIANSVHEQMEAGFNSDRIKGHLSDYEDDIKTKWEMFVTEPLAEVNKQNSLEKFGPYSTINDDDDFRDIPFPQDSGMQPFGYSTKEDRLANVNFDFNVDDSAGQSSQAEAMFDEACSTRMQQGDEEEDMWETKEISFADQSKSQESESGPPQIQSVKDGGDDDDDEWDFTQPAVRRTPAHIAAATTIFNPNNLADAFSSESASTSSSAPNRSAASSRSPRSTPVSTTSAAPTPQSPSQASAAPSQPAGNDDDEWETREITFSKEQHAFENDDGWRTAQLEMPPKQSASDEFEDDDGWRTKELPFTEKKPEFGFGVSSTTHNRRQQAQSGASFEDSDSEEEDADSSDKARDKKSKNKDERMEVDAFDSFTNYAMDTAMQDQSSSGSIDMDTSPWDNPTNNSNNKQQDEGWANFGSFEATPASSEQPSFADFSSMEAAPSEPSPDVEMEAKADKEAKADAVVDSTTKSAGGDAERPTSSQDPIVLPKQSQDNVSEQPSSSSETVPHSPEAIVDSNSNEARAEESSSEVESTTSRPVSNNMPNDNQVLEDHQDEKSDEELEDNFNFVSGLMGRSAEEQVSSSGQQDIEKIRAQAKAAMEEFSGATSSTTPD